jgi:hypothetical protein
VFAWARHHPRDGRFFGVANFAGRDAVVPEAALEWAGLSLPVAVVGDDSFHRHGDSLIIAPNGVVWFVDAADTPLCPAI